MCFPWFAPSKVSVLVMCHTRELAFQISKEYERFSKYMPNVKVRGHPAQGRRGAWMPGELGGTVAKAAGGPVLSLLASCGLGCSCAAALAGSVM